VRVKEAEVRNAVLLVSAVLAVMAEGALAETGGNILFADAFASSRLSPEWQAVEGEWRIADGALTNEGGGMMVLNKPLGSHFEIEAEINFAMKWASLIPFYATPQDYSTIYFFRAGYWETFETDDGQLSDLVQHPDPEITPGVYHRVRVVCEYNLASFYFDGTLKGKTLFRPRPGARLAFGAVKGGGGLRVKNLRVRDIAPAAVKVVRQLSAEDLARSMIYADYRLAGKPCDAARLGGDLASGAELAYGFKRDGVFESRFARIPLEAPGGRSLCIEVEGDGSKNTFFVIVHDRSGEQHLAVEACLTWQGWRELGVNLDAFRESPADKQRLATRWGGDGNQKIDFPITAVDLGVAKRGARVKDRGLVRFRNVRFVE
jgi:hypothetical protein